VRYLYFEALVGFCVADEDWEPFDFGDAFSIWTHIHYFYLEFFSNFKWVSNASSAVFCVSWGSFFWANRLSSSFQSYTVALQENKDFVF
jgi:hypothetical protein